VTSRDAVPDAAIVVGRVARALGPDRLHRLAAATIAERLLGDAIGVNLLLIGFAWQKGLIPVSRAAILRAIELNDVAVAVNKAAFEWGRVAAHGPQAIGRALGDADAEVPPPQTLDALVARRTEMLERYQDAAYAARFQKFVETVAAAERRVKPSENRLAEAVARNAYRLMAYKDEYEVARLFSDGGFKAALRRQFEGDLKLSFHLAPPLLGRRDAVTGRPRKITCGGWTLQVFRLLARLRALRGTKFDPFGYTAERRGERRLRDEYEATLRRLAARLDPTNYEAVLQIACIPEEIRGYGPVKRAAVEAAAERRADLLEQLDTPARQVALSA